MRRFRLFWVILLAASSVGTARADDATALRAKMRAAQASVHSLKMQISSPAGMTGVAEILNQPPRMHMTMAAGATVIEMYLVDGVLYQRIGGGGWVKHPVSMAGVSSDMVKTIDAATAIVTAPDVTEQGVVYGVVTMTTKTATIPGAPSAQPLTISCTYDKSSYRMHACLTGFMTQTFSDYDDPAIIVTLPADVAAAVDGGPLLPPGAPSPSP